MPTKVEPSEGLTALESATLATYETVIQQGLESFVEVGNALAKIRDGRLYRSEFGTFEDYCRTKWNLSRVHVHRLIDASEVVEDVLPIGNTPKNEAQTRPLATVPREERAAVWQEAVETAPKDESGAPKITAAHVQQVVDEKLGRPHVSHNSGENEWYTPPEFLEAARDAMGSIDLDPASSPLAQKSVRAKRYFTIADDGLSKRWAGNVWLNPPYSKDLIGAFVAKLREGLDTKAVKQAIVLVNNATDTAWFHDAAPLCSAMCCVKGRISFLDATGTPANKPLQGQVALYFGRHWRKFAAEFSQFGACFAGPASAAFEVE